MVLVNTARPVAIRTAIYVDGFNLYYWLKPTPFRWVDVRKLGLNALYHPSFRHQLVVLKYFTARVSRTATDPGKHLRQEMYLRAQQSICPEFIAYFGEFRRQRKRMPQVTANGGVGPLFDVWATE